MHPIKPEAERGERSMYNYDKNIKLSIPKDEAAAFAKLIDDRVIPAIKAGTNAAVYLPISKVNMLAVGSGVKEFGKVKGLNFCREKMDWDMKDVN